MIYGYIRVSTDKQTVENQRFEINRFCENKHIEINKWIEETISGTKAVDKRALGKLLKRLQKNDILICSELSRLGRSLFMIMDVLSACMKKEIQLWTIKDNYRLGSDISSKVLAFAFGLSAEIQRNLISQRTKEASSRTKASNLLSEVKIPSILLEAFVLCIFAISKSDDKMSFFASMYSSCLPLYSCNTESILTTSGTSSDCG